MGDSRNGDYVAVTYCDALHMPKLIAGVWSTVGAGKNEFLAAFNGEEWSNHAWIAFLQSMAPGLGVGAAMMLLDMYRGEGGEVTLEAVWKGVKEGMGGAGGSRLVGMELAKAQLKLAEWQ